MITIPQSHGNPNIELNNTALGESVQVAQNYFLAKPEIEVQINRARREFQGERLVAENKSLVDQLNALKTETISTIQTNIDGIVAEIDEKQKEVSEKNAALDPSDISQDYQFLGLPVTLTKEEINTLYERNSNNSLFVRALNEYIESKGIESYGFLDKPAMRKQAAENAKNSLTHHVSMADVTGLSIFIKTALKDIDDALKD